MILPAGHLDECRVFYNMMGWCEAIKVRLDFCRLAYATRRSSAKVICFELILSGSYSEPAMLDVFNACYLRCLRNRSSNVSYIFRLDIKMISH